MMMMMTCQFHWWTKSEYPEETTDHITIPAEQILLSTSDQIRHEKGRIFLPTWHTLVGAGAGFLLSISYECL